VTNRKKNTKRKKGQAKLKIMQKEEEDDQK
jgi:hypothetical protein